MDEAGIDKAAIVHSSTAYGYDNSYVAAAVAAVPSRFTAVCSIDVMAPDAVQTFDYWLGRGCTGMRLFTTGSTLPDQATWFVDPKTYPFWEHAAAKNIPVCMQMKQEGLPLLRQIMDRFPKVTMILDHLALDTFGASRIAWGSNFPNSVGTLSELLDAARKAFSFASAEQRDWIFGRTAQRLYPKLAE
ncbi:MAG: hypothetical protein E6G86_20380 [Alphaproteobacteria bacterium]|nr:MAG: hypothetical protein E6G86_20380 [Alphaproteobacteria bacterium]